jgi:hypothetical protein
MKRVVCSAICCLVLTSGFLDLPQTSAQQGAPAASVHFLAAKPAGDGGQFFAMNAYLSLLTKRMEADRRREMNADRQRHLELDTSKLVDLVNDLSRDMRGEKELTPLDLSRRAAEIERLAHEVQERMKG